MNRRSRTGTRRGSTARRTAAVLVTALVAASALTAPAQAQATRYRAGSASDVSRASWSGPALVLNGAGAVVEKTMRQAVDHIRGGSGALDAVVVAGSLPGSGSATPECDAIMRAPGVNSCTTWVLTARRDGDDSRVNADLRAAEFVYFAGGDQCRYTDWIDTELPYSVDSVVAKGGGVGGGSAGLHIQSDVVYDACAGSVTSAEALADPYDRAISFTTGLFRWSNFADTVNDSHFVTRNRMGRTIAFVARAIEDQLTSGDLAWGVGVEEGASLFVDRAGLGRLSGPTSYVVLGDHRPERAEPGRSLTFRGVKIWRLADGATFDFARRPTCGYYLRDVVSGVIQGDPYQGAPVC